MHGQRIIASHVPAEAEFIAFGLEAPDFLLLEDIIFILSKTKVRVLIRPSPHSCHETTRKAINCLGLIKSTFAAYKQSAFISGAEQERCRTHWKTSLGS